MEGDNDVLSHLKRDNKAISVPDDGHKVFSRFDYDLMGGVGCHPAAVDCTTG